MQNLKEAIKLIDKKMIKNWVEDLVISKTFNGLYVQKAILSKSIKPDTYKTMGRLSEIMSLLHFVLMELGTGDFTNTA